jgi:signal transduction histidine kinase
MNPFEPAGGWNPHSVATDQGVVWASDGNDLHFYVDSEAITQAVYVYRPILNAEGRIVDLEVVRVNEAAQRVPLAAHIVEGVRASDVFVDPSVALDAANQVWSGEVTQPYHIERRGVDADVPMVVHYEVKTLRVGEFVVQVSTDHTTVTQLESADARFRLMADASDTALVLFVRDSETGAYVIGYANPAARKQVPTIRYGATLPPEAEVLAPDLLEAVRSGQPLRRVVSHSVLARHSDFLVIAAPVGPEEVMLSWRELTDAQIARDELRRSDRVLEAIGRGAFGSIAVYEPVEVDGRLTELSLMWEADGHSGTHEAIGLRGLIPERELLRMAQQVQASGGATQTGWLSVPQGAEQRSVEFTLVQAGDRFVLEAVERTRELAARTELAAFTASAEARRTFLSRVSHEMRSPLNVINGYSQLLQRVALDASTQAFAVGIAEGVQRMVTMVDDLLLLGQIEQGVVHFEQRALTIGELHAAVVEHLVDEPYWSAPTVEASDTSRFSAVVRTDPARFAAVIGSLLEVGVEAHPSDRVRLDTFMRGARAGLQLVAHRDSATVRDFWMPFVASHVIPGVGLGMAVARSLISALGVEAEVRFGVASPDDASLTLTLEPTA